MFSHSGERRRLLNHTATFWLLAGIYGVFMFAASAPSPLYGVYAARFHFSTLMITVIFSVYAIGLLGALLVTGRLSDHLGRRPVILGAIGLELVAIGLFLLADSTAVLLVGRALQGIATGAAIGALSAGIIELAGAVPAGVAPMVTSSAPIFGLAAGAVGSSALVQYGPIPLRLIFWVIIGALVVGAGLTLVATESGTRRAGALQALRPVAKVPNHARPHFVKVLPSLVALWALNGFYLSLGPTLVGQIQQSHNLLWGGAAVFSFTFAGGIVVLALRGASSHMAMFAGCATLLIGVLITFVAIATSTTAVFLVGSVIAGGGFGLAFLGAIRTVSDVAAPHERAGTLAVFYVVSYLAFSVPIVIAGVAETHYSSHDVALVFSGVVALLAAIGAVTGLIEFRRHRGGGTRPGEGTSDRALADLSPLVECVVGDHDVAPVGA